MDLNLLYSAQRTGENKISQTHETRSEFQRDFDRIIFSSSFRRLQNKTQVFPLPGSVFVHNRLTHSLEVASVGRSLGSLIGQFIAETYAKDLNPESLDFYKYSLYNVIASACLCHDIGNPAFGHSGEDAIASFFVKNQSSLKSLFQPKEWEDLINFEGNANAIRVLTQQQKGKSEGGFQLTFSTLAAIAKYPCESCAKGSNGIHTKKFGFFQSEKQSFRAIAQHTNMFQNKNEALSYLRHPFVWLVEAADDICYNIIDFEDAHRLGIVEHRECLEQLHDLVMYLDPEGKKKIEHHLAVISDKNDKISYLRAKSISGLTLKSKQIFENHFDDFLNGNYQEPLFDCIKKDCPTLSEIVDFSRENIYNNRSVVEIENAGYNVMNELLLHFIPVIIKETHARNQSEKKALKLLPPEFNYDGESVYARVLGVLDYISGMTDNYATDFYKRIKGFEIGMKI